MAEIRQAMHAAVTRPSTEEEEVSDSQPAPPDPAAVRRAIEEAASREATPEPQPAPRRQRQRRAVPPSDRQLRPRNGQRQYKE